MDLDCSGYEAGPSATYNTEATITRKRTKKYTSPVSYMIIIIVYLIKRINHKK